MNDKRQALRSYIIDSFLFGQDEGLEDETSFLEAGILDSTGVMQLVSHLESTHGIEIDSDELLPENLDSINLICAFIERKKVATPAG